jgi:hypothetical protein
MEVFKEVTGVEEKILVRSIANTDQMYSTEDLIDLQSKKETRKAEIAQVVLVKREERIAKKDLADLKKESLEWKKSAFICREIMTKSRNGTEVMNGSGAHYATTTEIEEPNRLMER